MANSGQNTNGSQFFITFVATKHLNGKHVVFGQVLAGLGLLREMELIETEENDKVNFDLNHDACLQLSFYEPQSK